MNKDIDIRVSKSYRVHLGEDNFNFVLNYITNSQKVCVITDENVKKYHLNTILNILKGKKINYFIYSLKPGEESKNLKVVSDVMNFLCQRQFSRSDLIIALGGGVVGDLAGFCAAIYQRGIDYIQIPTTLLACVDSSVGGKTGVDLPGGKNLVGSFKQPVAVIIDTNTLKTLPIIEFNNGIYECIKYGILFDRNYFDIFLKEDFSVKSKRLKEVIEKAIKFKESVVIEDENDLGNRRLLNLGHTFGHAIEQASGYNIKHGYAVGIGIEIVSKISFNKGFLSQNELNDILEVINKYKLIDYPAIKKEDLLKYIFLDKKIFDGYLNIIMVEKIGKPTIKKIKLDSLEDLLKIETKYFN